MATKVVGTTSAAEESRDSDGTDAWGEGGEGGDRDKGGNVLADTTLAPQTSVGNADGDSTKPLAGGAIGLICGVVLVVLVAVLWIWYKSSLCISSRGYDVEAAGAGVDQASNVPAKRPLPSTFQNPTFDEQTYDTATRRAPIALTTFNGYDAHMAHVDLEVDEEEEVGVAPHASHLYDNAAGVLQLQAYDAPASPLYAEASSPTYATAAGTNLYDHAASSSAEFAEVEKALHATAAVGGNAAGVNTYDNVPSTPATAGEPFYADTTDGPAQLAHIYDVSGASPTEAVASAAAGPGAAIGVVENAYTLPHPGQPEVYARMLSMQTGTAEPRYEDMDAEC